MLGPTHRKAGLIFRDADSQGMKAIDSGRKHESDDEERNHRGRCVHWRQTRHACTDPAEWPCAEAAVTCRGTDARVCP